MEVPALSAYFDDGTDIRSPLEEDGTTIKYCSTKSNFVWDHGNIECHFIHGYRQLPGLILYVGHGYLNAFCMRVHKLPRDKVIYDFLSD